MNHALKLAAEFNRYFTSSNGVDVPERVSVSRDEWRQLHAALQAEQPDSPWTENVAVKLEPSRTGRVYIAGPMTGIAEFNFPAFNKEAVRLRAEGLTVLNPADHGIVEGAEWADYLRHDIAGLATCQRIHLLPGWEKSKGARLEVTIAQALGMAITLSDGAASPASTAAQAEVKDLTIERVFLDHGLVTTKRSMRAARAILALRPQQSGLTGCNCRWDGDTQVQWCELHLAHKEAIHEWAERAKEAEKQLTLRPAAVPMTDEVFDLICNAIDKADTISMEGDYMLDSDDCIVVVRVMQALLSIHHGITAQA